jgi:hypothetical protein
MISKSLTKKMAKTYKKNTVRKVTKEVAEIVRDRDRICRICMSKPIEHMHHAYYGLDSVYGTHRNDADQLVGLCNTCHYLLHFM